MTRHAIGTVEDFPEGQGRRVDVDGIRIAVFNVDGELYGIQDLCTHRRLPLHPAGSDLVVDEDYRREHGNKRFTMGRITGSCGGAEERDETDDRRSKGEAPDAMPGPTVACPWHGLPWDLTTGENPVNDQRISTFDVDVEAGTVYLEI